MLPLVDRYLLSEVGKALLAILITLMLIVTSMLFLRTLEEVSLGALNADLVLRFLGLQLVRDTSTLLPPSFFLAALGGLGRLARDSELVALNACGIGPRRLYRALFLLALPVALVTGLFALILQPWASAGIAEIRLAQKDQATQVAGLQAGRFYVEDDGQSIIYVGSITKEKRLERVFLLSRQGKKTQLVVSDTGSHRVEQTTGDHLVTLNDGHRFDGNAGEGDYMIGEFREYLLRIDGQGPEPTGIKKNSTVPSRVLLASPDPAAQGELQHRIAAPLAIFTLLLVAVPLIAISPRQKTTGRLVLAFLAYFTFFNLQQLAETWLENGTTPLWLTSFWYQLLVVALVYLVMLPETLWYRGLRERLRHRVPAAA
ncbi:LPS export ABC transporter permease LptF [uncultured Thiodictyon sp.]|uniref:LPS export ABC transporter permease LptF n=1 Tax=uncultured Thiodictyon sp. TaxID=1846217 RepID=UPI0025D6B62D|nr:LPS export ABC transporter permease LptF [uncultured Thiodictyon sp.]